MSNKSKPANDPQDQDASLIEAASMEADLMQFLNFELDNQRYAVPIKRVQEIRSWERVTRLPNTADFVRGVINLRGAIVPVFDLRLKFGLAWRDYADDTVVIVLSVKDDEKTRSMGLVVDGVSDVLQFTAQQIRPAPDFGSNLPTEAIRGLATLPDGAVTILDVDQLMVGHALAEAA